MPSHPDVYVDVCIQALVPQAPQAYMKICGYDVPVKISNFAIHETL